MNLFEDMLYNTPYSICGFCHSQIKSQEEARWVDIGNETWAQISCTECASAHPPEKVTEVQVPKEVAEIIEIDEKVTEMNDLRRKLDTERIQKIKSILQEEGYRPGLTINFCNRNYVVTGMETANFGNSRRSVDIIVYPAKKDGSASKQNRSRLAWNDFIRLYRMQRANPEGYAAAARKRADELREKRDNFKVTDDML